MIVDVETAFLYGNLEEEIYMNIPQGFLEVEGTEENPNICCRLLKSIYGLVQAARQWWKRCVDQLKKWGFELSKADPCLLCRKDEKGTCIVIMYVDDILVVGDRLALEDLKEKFMKAFSVKVEYTLKDYLGCELVMHKNKKMAWLGQPSIIQSLKTKFGEFVEKVRLGKTPGTPGYTTVRTENKEDCSPPQEQTFYRSGVGTLLYLTKHSRPDICNATRELSKAMDGANTTHMKELQRVIKFVLATSEYGLKIQPRAMQNSWNLVAYSDADFAADKDTRISVYGYVVYFMGVPIAWKSKGMKSVVLSTTEAEYVAVSEVVKEIRFVMNVLESMKIELKLPITLYVDNIGAIWLTGNQSTSERTKHIDVPAHYVREYIEDDIIKIVFVKSEDNIADIETKNLPTKLQEKHAQKLICKKEEVMKENENGELED
ncbi:hypothetical protein ACA910_011037 [Epithemia clementina (nom. ined.)]